MYRLLAITVATLVLAGATTASAQTYNDDRTLNGPVVADASSLRGYVIDAARNIYPTYLFGSDQSCVEDRGYGIVVACSY
jgi:hypothetical protein